MKTLRNLANDFSLGHEIICFLTDLRTEMIMSDKCRHSSEADDFIVKINYILDDDNRKYCALEKITDLFKNPLPFLGSLANEYYKIQNASDLILEIYEKFKDAKTLKQVTIDRFNFYIVQIKEFRKRMEER